MGVYARTDMPERPPLRRVRAISRANALRTKSDNDKPHICAASRMTAISDGVTYAEQRTLFVSPIVGGRPRPRLGCSCMAQMSLISLQCAQERPLHAPYPGHRFPSRARTACATAGRPNSPWQGHPINHTPNREHCRLGTLILPQGMEQGPSGEQGPPMGGEQGPSGEQGPPMGGEQGP